MLQIPKKFKTTKCVTFILSLIGILVSLWINKFFEKYIAAGCAIALLIEIVSFAVFIFGFCSLLPLEDNKNVKVTHVIKEFSEGLNNILFMAGISVFPLFVSSIVVNGEPFKQISLGNFFYTGIAAGGILTFSGLNIQNMFIKLLVKRKKLPETEFSVTDDKLIRIFSAVLSVTLSTQAFLNIFIVLPEKANTVYFPLLLYFESLYPILIHRQRLSDYLD